MRRTKLNSYKFHGANLQEIAAVALLLVGCIPGSSLAQQQGQKTFSSAEEASNALVTAAQNNDEKAMLDILGSAGQEVVSSGDDTEDTDSRANFVRKYQEMHRLVKEPDGTTTLYIGAENWPTPIPLRNRENVWYFDTEAARQEILFRRIGRNELSAIRVCQELVAAEKEFSSAHQSQYAQKTYSDQGQHDGLYWKAGDSEPQSPIGPLLARAVATSDSAAQDAGPTPFRGYYYRILTRQGKGAPGGAKNYVVDGKMTGGFAFVAYPALYRSSGVMTFIVGQDGVIYQKDLGKRTDSIAKSLKAYDPNSSWQKADEQMEATAGDQTPN